MSHLVRQVSSTVKITSLDHLGKACTKLGLKLDPSRKIARYYGSSTAACDAVIEIPGCSSEIAVKKLADGSYGVEADHYYREVTEALGKNSDNLFQRYRAEELIEEAVNNNMSVDYERFNINTQELELNFLRN